MRLVLRITIERTKRRLYGMGLIAMLTCSLHGTAAHAQWVQDGVAVCTAAGDQSRPAIIPDGQGGAYIVWEDRRGSDPQIYAQRLNALGVPQWSPNGILVSSGFYPQYGPVAVGDATGGVIVAWILSIVPEAFEGRGQRLNGNGAVQWAGGGIPITPGVALPRKLAIVSDGRVPQLQPAGAILAWSDSRSGNLDVYVGAVDAFGVQRWATPVCTAGGDQLDVQVVTDGSGTATNPKGAILAWRDLRQGQANDDIYAQRVNAGGVVQWSANGVGIATDPSTVQAPALVPAGSQNAIVGWPGFVGSRGYGLFGDRAGSTGSWGAPTPMAEPNGGQNGFVMTSDFAGGFVAAWSRLAIPLSVDVYAQRVNSSGLRQWGDDGKLVCVSPAAESAPILVPGRSSTWLAVWRDTRNGSQGDLYAQLLDANGIRAWGDGGIPLCTAPAQQLEFVGTPDSTGGAIVAWTDYRNGGTDIYASRVTGTGGVVAVDVMPLPTRLRLASAAPNPTRAGVRLALDLPSAGEVSATVHDAAGRRARVLLDRVAFEAGNHTIAWDARDEQGSHVPAGIYWVSVRAGGERAGQRVVVIE